MIIIDNKIKNILLLLSAFGTGSIKAFGIYKELSERKMLDMPICDSTVFLELDDKSRDKILGVKYKNIEKIIECCNNKGISIIPIYDSVYPRCLLNIHVPPLVLFCKGSFPDFDNNPVFCIVGPRKITDFGKKAAYSLARRLARAGMIIVGGAAKGGDNAVHTGTLSAEGRCVMITAEGIITQMNSKNHQLCENIIKNGCIISENFPEYIARKYDFPIRNRIMSGLSLGVAVVEAPEKSGTLITAGHALDQGRDVFVVPGNPVDKAYKGSNALLRDGAIPLIDASDIFTRYIADFPEQINIENAYKDSGDDKLKKNLQKKSLSTLSNEAQLVYNNLDKPKFTADDLYLIDMDDGLLLSALTELEMEHLIKSLPGGAYKIIDQ